MAIGKKDCAIPALLLLLTALVYIDSLDIPFVIDDQHIIVRNLFLRHWSLGAILKTHLFSPLGVETQYYRPLTLLTFAVNYGFSELTPRGYHLVNLSLHLAVVGLTYLLLSRFVSPWTAGFATALFAVHPANVQAVSYISSRSDPLYTMLVLLSLLCWSKGNENRGPKRIILLTLSTTSFFLGLFAKEAAIVAPALIVLTDLTWNGDLTWKEKIQRNWIWYLSLAAMLGVYLLIRTGFAGYGLSMEGSKEVWKAGQSLGSGSRIILAAKLLGLYLGLIIYPLNLSFFRDVAVPESPLDAGALAGVFCLAVLVSLAWSCRSKKREVSFGIFWFLIGIVPVLNLTSLNAPMMEHWVYLPLVGFLLAFVASAHALGKYLGEIRGVAWGLVLLAILLSARTVARNAEWGDPVGLFLEDTRRYPNEEKNWFLLGYAYAERAHWNEAVRAYRKGLAISPNHAYAWSGLGEALSMAGRDQEAEWSLRKAISIMPSNPWLYYVLGVERLKRGKTDAAIEVLKQAVALTPVLPMARHVLGSAYLRQGRKEEAEREFRKALSMPIHERGLHAAVHVQLGKLYLTEGKRREAREEWRLALRFDPGSKEARALLQLSQPETP